MKKIRWGVLSTAKIGIEKVIPAMQAGEYSEVTAIASRDLAKAQAAARHLGLPKAYGSYEELLADANIDAIYNPLPNHLHVPWSIKALAAGKHILCEKPLAMDAREADELLAESKKFPRLKVMEAFMYRFHPQWQRARELVVGGHIGKLRTIHTHFSGWNVDPKNVRNIAAYGGGGMMDLGCYCLSLARFIFAAEPRRALGLVEYDPAFQIDRLASGVLEFDDGTSTFTCSMQLTSYQRVNIFGTEGRIEIEIPFNAPPDKPCRLWHQQGQEIKEILFDICNQYTLQGDQFSRAILEDLPVPTLLEDAVANMRAIEAIVQSSKAGTWVKL